MRNRKQTGQIIAISGRWFVRYYERVNRNGVIERRRVTHCLGPITTRGTHPPADTVKDAEDFMRDINHPVISADRTITLSEFWEQEFLPHVKQNLRLSTYRGYRQAWELHIKPVSSRDRVLLKDVKTFVVQKWLNQIGREALARNTLKRVQSALSGCFKHAKRSGFFDGVNPVQDTNVNPHAAEAAETYAYSLEEIQAILVRLREPAATVFAVASFAGLRRGEIEGLDWSDYSNGELHVQRSIWNGRINPPKTSKSRAAVPVIRQLSELLEFHRLRSSRKDGPMFTNSENKRLNLNNLLNRQILPALNVCRHCGVGDGKAHLKQDHEYERDKSIPCWRGFHSARRGLASNLYRLGVSDKTIQQILRHSNLNTTMSFYVKTASPDVVAGMQKLEEKLNAETLEKTGVQSSRDSFGTLNQAAGAMPRIVN